ncbi:IS3 family transposase [Dictyobacter formicarum]|nr:IS3 family transposase [Dictyobacter formicarum]
MAKKQRVYTTEFKQEAVQLMETSGKSIAQLARDLGVSDSALHSWRKSIAHHGNQAFPGKGHQTELEEKLRRLERENEILRQERDILKKTGAYLRATAMMKYQCIFEHHQDYPVKRMCAAFSVSESGYYAWLKRETCQRAKANELLLHEIEQIFHEHRSVYGSPRIHVALRDQGMQCGRKRVARLMRLHGISARRRRSRVQTTNSEHSFPIAANLLNRNFTAETPDRVWVSDFTYVGTREGWLYLATVLDVYSRRVVGWSMSHERTEELVLAALQMAVTWRKPAPGLIHHSDRGSQYASLCYQSQLQRHGIVASMSRKGDCYDNALAESFFATLKAECADRQSYTTRIEARQDLFLYIEEFYNRKQLHSALGYVSPLTFEEGGEREKSE